MQKSSTTVLSLIAAAMMLGGWVVLAIGAGEVREREAVSAAFAQSCAHERGFEAGLANYLPLSKPQPAPLQPFKDANGNAITLADFRGTGIVLNFWATWCAPCVAEMPALDRLDAELADEGIRVVAVSEDRKPEEMSPPFYVEHGLTSLGQYGDEKMQLARAAKVGGLPTTLLINRNGDEVASVLGAAEWDDPKVVDFLRQCLLADG